ncbi:carbon-nitrogen hydrolase [Lentinula raphanica]|uniref:Carbon-nitrogen hydrolase n=1 Tax=Lentinula raphanica TaxID=153919 RepID=A0AA38P7P6_9AGAR|nr:carbon-nitrogen hydrolase [Lentinula raphanica]
MKNLLDHSEEQTRDYQALRIALVQYSPKLGEVEDNMERVEELCSRIEPGSVDLVCFPEMALSGYVFHSPTEISPYLEIPQEGPTSRMCERLARRVGCFVVAGYPERLVLNTTTDIGVAAADRPGANSAIVYGPKGEFIGNYQKTNLWVTDKSWARPGPTCFASFTLPKPIGTLVLGICMDLNAHPPADWQSVEAPYEFGEYAAKKISEGEAARGVAVLVNAWLDSGVWNLEEEEETKEKAVDWTTVKFWINRLRPLWDFKSEKDRGRGLGGAENKETIVVICNRTGVERGKYLVAPILKFRQCSGGPRLVGIMSRQEEGVSVWEVG